MTLTRIEMNLKTESNSHSRIPAALLVALLVLTNCTEWNVYSGDSTNNFAAHAKSVESQSKRSLSGSKRSQSRVSGSADAKELDAFLKLRKLEDRAAADFYFETHPNLAKNSKALAENGMNLAAMRFYEKAVELTKRAVDINPNDNYACASAAYCLNRQKSTAAALKYINRAVSSEPSARSFAIMAEVYESKGAPSQAAIGLLQAERIDKNSFDLARARSFIARTRYAPQQALEPINIYIEQHPKDLQAIILRAETYSLLGRHNDAIKDHTRVLTLHPGHTGALQGRGDEYRHLQKWKLGAADIRKLLGTKKVGSLSGQIANFTLAKCLEGSGDWNDALKVRNEMLQNHLRTIKIDLSSGRPIKDSTTAKYLIECVTLQNKVKQYALALKNCDMVLAGRPVDAAALEQRAIALEGLGRTKDAVKAWSVLVEQHKNYPKWLEARARVYKQLGDHAAAKRDLDAVAALNNELN